MQITGHFIFTGQYISEKSGKGTVKMVDLENGGTLKVTLETGTLDDGVIANKTPVQLVIDGVEFRQGDNGVYLVCQSITGQAARKSQP